MERQFPAFSPDKLLKCDCPACNPNLDGCLNCQKKLGECPLCRRGIERLQPRRRGRPGGGGPRHVHVRPPRPALCPLCPRPHFTSSAASRPCPRPASCACPARARPSSPACPNHRCPCRTAIDQPRARVRHSDAPRLYRCNRAADKTNTKQANLPNGVRMG